MTSVIRQSARVLPSRAQVVEDRRPQVGRGHRPVVAVAELEDVPAVPAHEPERRVDLVELREVERDVVDVVLQRVDDRPGPAMADLAFEEVRPHAARSSSAVAASRSATS